MTNRHRFTPRQSRSAYLWLTTAIVLVLVWMCVANIRTARQAHYVLSRRSEIPSTITIEEATTELSKADGVEREVIRPVTDRTDEAANVVEITRDLREDLDNKSSFKKSDHIATAPKSKKQRPLELLDHSDQSDADARVDDTSDSSDQSPSATQQLTGDDMTDDTGEEPAAVGDSRVASQNVYAQPGPEPQAFGKYAQLVEQAEELPEVVFIPFEDAVKDDELEPWAAEWIANGVYDPALHGLLPEPRIDFVYTWVNGSEEEFARLKRPYEQNSSLNDAEGKWLASHSNNRYRDWNELKYSVRSVERYAPFRNKIQLLVNDVPNKHKKQVPSWLDTSRLNGIFEVLGQRQFWEKDKQECLPVFNSISMENQIHSTDSGVDRVFAMSDDMLLGKPHAAADIFSPLFGPMLAFKTNAYSSVHRPSDADAQRFGEKPWLIYTSWLLNRRFGNRKRKGQVHFGHSLSRKVAKEAMNSFPGPELQSACSRFRGDFGFQLYSWYAMFHYTIERHREALLWSYLIHRSDADGDGYLSWSERQIMIQEIQEGLVNEASSSYRARTFYHLPELLEQAGLEAPKVNLDILWTSMDGPITMKDLDCFTFDVNDCLAPGFSAPGSKAGFRSPVFSASTIFDRVSRQQPECGDCLAKIILHRVPRGLSSMLPNNKTQTEAYKVVTKALMRYQYVVNEPDALFVMVTDAEQVDSVLNKRILEKKKSVGQLCLNDDVSTEDEGELEQLYQAMHALFEGLQPKPSRFEKR